MRTISNLQIARDEIQSGADSVTSKLAVFSLLPNNSTATELNNQASRPEANPTQGFLGHIYLPVAIFSDVDPCGVIPLLSLRILQNALLTVGGLRAETLILRLKSLREINTQMRATATFMTAQMRGMGSSTLRRPEHIKFNFTTCGCIISLYKGSRKPFFLICPEGKNPNEPQPREPIFPNTTLLWESRLAISCSFTDHRLIKDRPTELLFVRRLTPRDHRVFGQAHRDPPSEIRQSTPVITNHRDEVVAFPTWNYTKKPHLLFKTAAIYPLTLQNQQ